VHIKLWKEDEQMKRNVVMGVILSVILLAGCGQDATLPTSNANVLGTDRAPLETAEQDPPPPPPEPAPPTTITERTQVNGQIQSYLTGEWKDADVVNRRSMAVMIPDNKPALPQYGISHASIIYEAPVEGRCTRLMAFFEDYDDLDHLGPIRSSRDYFVYEAMAYDAIYVNWGLARPFVEDLLRSDRIDNVSQALAGIHNPAPEAFDRISRKGYATEFTGYLFIDGYNEAVERLGYQTTYRDTFVQAFTFAADDYPALYEEAEDVTMIYPGGSENNKGGYWQAKQYFAYDKSDGLYYRYQYDAPQIDEENGEQLAVSNVIFKICHGEVREPKGKDYLAFGVHGDGEAYIFTAGKMIHGTWKRASDNEPNLFFDENGEEIVFNQGKTWICNIWKEYSEFMEWE
jgi:hypothetical protein